MKGKWVVLFVLGTLLCCIVFPAPVMGYVGDIHIADIKDDGTQGDVTGNVNVSISDDGRYVAFVTADSLATNDTNGVEDVYVRDMQNGVTYWVSADSNGNAVNQRSHDCSISGNGRYVAFTCGSDALLAAGDSNGQFDVFVYDLVSRTTELVSYRTGGAQANGTSAYPSISDDGHYVVFVSYASNLIAAGTSGGHANVYIHDRDTDETLLLSKSTGGGEANDECTHPVISGNGQYVAFESEATDLVGVGAGFAANQKDIYVCDRQGNGMELVSISSADAYGDGESRYPTISDDGNYVAFDSVATTLDGGDGIRYNVFARDRSRHQTQIMSINRDGNIPNNHSMNPSYSDDGLYILYESFASDLVDTDNNGWDIFVYDLLERKTKLISRSSKGEQANDDCHDPCLSGNAEYVAFSSLADNLVLNDNDALYDLFVKQIGGAVRPMSTSASDDNDAKLIALGTSAGALSPVFDPAVTGYSQSVGSGVKSVTVTAIAADPRDPTNIRINGVLVASGTASDPIPLNPGSNTITVEINGRRGSTTYTITVTRGEQNPKTGDYPAYWLWIAIAGGALLLSTTTLYLRSRAKNRA